MKAIMPFRHVFSHGAGFSAASSGGDGADGGERTS
jgi:hypothetical protein